MAAIITLRQEVLTGTKQFVSSLTVKEYTYADSLSEHHNDKVIYYELLDGRKGIVPINNIDGICELKEN
jgi:hypothetical protein